MAPGGALSATSAGGVAPIGDPDHHHRDGRPSVPPHDRSRSGEDRVLDATKACCARYGVGKVTIDDIAVASNISRATIYRLFPGGKDVIFEALRLRELEEFFETLRSDVEGATTIEDVIVRTVVGATRELRADDHLALMLAAEPGEALNQLTVAGVPRIIRFATAFLSPFVEPYLDRATARALIDVLARLVISYFLAPSDTVDLGDDQSARSFVLPLLQPFLSLTPSTGG